MLFLPDLKLKHFKKINKAYICLRWTSLTQTNSIELNMVHPIPFTGGSQIKEIDTVWKWTGCLY